MPGNSVKNSGFVIYAFWSNRFEPEKPDNFIGRCVSKRHISREWVLHKDTIAGASPTDVSRMGCEEMLTE